MHVWSLLWRPLAESYSSVTLVRSDVQKKNCGGMAVNTHWIPDGKVDVPYLVFRIHLHTNAAAKASGLPVDPTNGE